MLSSKISIMHNLCIKCYSALIYCRFVSVIYYRGTRGRIGLYYCIATHIIERV